MSLLNALRKERTERQNQPAPIEKRSEVSQGNAQRMQQMANQGVVEAAFEQRENAAYFEKLLHSKGFTTRLTRGFGPTVSDDMAKPNWRVEVTGNMQIRPALVTWRQKIGQKTLQGNPQGQFDPMQGRELTRADIERAGNTAKQVAKIVKEKAKDAVLWGAPRVQKAAESYLKKRKG